MRSLSIVALSCCFGLACLAGCGDDDNPPPSGGGGGAGLGGSGGIQDQTGAACEVAEDCFPEIDGGTLSGEAMCLDRVRGGYCTHTCEADADCCAVPGECIVDSPQLCAPFESTDTKMCFLSCEESDMRVDGGAVSMDEQEYCQRLAHSSFICRSSGGGSSNRKICVPGNCGVGAACILPEDCATGLTCVTSWDGGYCTVENCTADADCPNNSACVKHVDGKNYCLRRCQGDGDCNFCRTWSDDAVCSADVTFVETTTTGSVCAP